MKKPSIPMEPEKAVTMKWYQWLITELIHTGEGANKRLRNLVHGDPNFFRGNLTLSVESKEPYQFIILQQIHFSKVK